MIKRRTVTNKPTSTAATAPRNSLLRGLRQALAYERGELKSQVRVYDVPRRIARAATDATMKGRS